jgi:hypothetical protein
VGHENYYQKYLLLLHFLTSSPSLRNAKHLRYLEIGNKSVDAELRAEVAQLPICSPLGFVRYIFFAF